MRQDARLQTRFALGDRPVPAVAGPLTFPLDDAPASTPIGPPTGPDPRLAPLPDDDAPLVVLGQGDSRREISPATATDALDAIGRGLVAALVAVGSLLVVVPLLAALAGCSPSTAMRGPATDATHETTPAVRERTIELRIGGDELPVNPDDFPPRGAASDAAERHGAGPSRPAPVAGLAGSNTAIMHALLAVSIAATPDDADAVTRALDAARDAANAGRRASVTIRETETGGTVSSTLNQRGGELDTDNAEIAGRFDASGGQAEMPYRTAGAVTLGGTKIRAEVTRGGGVNALHAIGALAVIAAGVAFWLTRSLALTVGLAAAGGGLIALGTMTESAPWLLVVIAVGVLIAVGVGVYAAYRKRGMGDALAAVAAAVERHPEVKPDIQLAAGDRIRTVRREVRRVKDKLETEPATQRPIGPAGEAGSRER